MPSRDILAIIPASGKGERFGMPKVEAILDGISFPDIIRERLNQAGIDDVQIARDLSTGSMLETLRVTVRDAEAPALGYLVHPVDHPYVQAATIIKLIDAFRSLPDAVVRPTYQGRSGHPVLIPRWLDFFADDDGKGLAGLIRAQICTIIDVPVDDSGVLRNVNTGADLEPEDPT